jgi:hypothetical protein
VSSVWLTVTSVHEQSAHVKSVCAITPAHAGVPASPPFTTMGGPPPVQPPAGGFPTTDDWQDPLPLASVTQPWPAGHLLPQAPQSSLSEPRSTHAPLHAVRPGMHVDEQTPPEHADAPVHLIPQAPQLFGSLLVGMHAPPQNDS